MEALQPKGQSGAKARLIAYRPASVSNARNLFLGKILSVRECYECAKLRLGRLSPREC